MGALIALPSRLRTGAASGVMKKSPLRPRPYYERVKQQLALLLRVLEESSSSKSAGFLDSGHLFGLLERGEREGSSTADARRK